MQMESGFNMYVLCLTLLSFIRFSVKTEDIVNFDSETNSASTWPAACSEIQTNAVGNIDFTLIDLLQFFNQSSVCIFHIRVVEASNILVMLSGTRPDEATELFVLGRALNISVFGRIPGEEILPVHICDNITSYNTVFSINSSEIWLRIDLSVDEVIASNLPNDDTMQFWSIAYVSNVNNTVPICNSEDIPPAPNGQLISSGDMFGSTILLRCDSGYFLQDDSGHTLQSAGLYAVCSVLDGSLAWVSGLSQCDSVCEQPPLVANADMTPHMDVTVLLQDSKAASHRTHSLYNNTDPPRVTSHRNNTSTMNATLPDLGTFNITATVQYSCHEPFLIRGQNFLHCGSEAGGAPRWNGPPPSCVIPDCSAPVTLRQRSGALVPPSYPNSDLTGGSGLCSWDIEGPVGSIIQFYTVFLDLPDSPAVQINISDTSGESPMNLIKLTNQSRPENVTCHSHRATVFYRRPTETVEGLRGFYLKYEIFQLDSNETLNGIITPTTKTEITTEHTTTEVTHAGASNFTTQTLSSSSDITLDLVSSNGDDWWEIPVYIFIPMCLLICVLAGIYQFYRIKYPVRMIFGRQFGKFSNPQYLQSSTYSPSLIRDDASLYFEGESALNTPQNIRKLDTKVVFDNLAFSPDDGDDIDEKHLSILRVSRQQEAPRGSFMQSSEQTMHKNTTETEKRHKDTTETEKRHKDTTETEKSSKSNFNKEKRHSLPEILNRIKFKHSEKSQKSRDKDTKENICSAESNQRNCHLTNLDSASCSNKTTSEVGEGKDNAQVVHDEVAEERTTTTINSKTHNFIESSMVLFQQPTFEEAWQVAKARSRSMSTDLTSTSVRVNIASSDLSKSARKMSLKDAGQMIIQTGLPKKENSLKGTKSSKVKAKSDFCRTDNWNGPSSKQVIETSLNICSEIANTQQNLQNPALSDDGSLPYTSALKESLTSISFRKSDSAHEQKENHTQQAVISNPCGKSAVDLEYQNSQSNKVNQEHEQTLERKSSIQTDSSLHPRPFKPDTEGNTQVIGYTDAGSDNEDTGPLLTDKDILDVLAQLEGEEHTPTPQVSKTRRTNKSVSKIQLDDKNVSVVQIDDKNESNAHTNDRSVSIVHTNDRIEANTYADDRSMSIVQTDYRSESNTYTSGRSMSVEQTDDVTESSTHTGYRSMSTVQKDDIIESNKHTHLS